MISEKKLYIKIANEYVISYNLSIVERERRSPYKEFQPGDTLDFNLQTLLPDGSIRVVSKTVLIEAVKDGGFFGKVLIIKDEPLVIKTSLPDPWHHLWRSINWDNREFPAQVNEVDAQLEHLATGIIHRVLPTMSGGKFYSPDSLGYAKLSTGYAQVVEKIDGRPPRFDTEMNEYEEFRKAQKELSELAFRLGLEQVGQIHPDNPFGMANIWFDEKNIRFVWLDTNPAIAHKDFIKPFFRFKFGKDIRKQFGTTDVTFNRIRTGQLDAEVLTNSDLFSPEVLDEIRKNIRLYATLMTRKEPTSINGQEAKEALIELSRDLARTALYFLPNVAIDILKIARDPRYLKDLLLSGAREARKQGVITEEEFEKAKIEVEGENEKKLTNLQKLFLWYFLSGQAINAIEGTFYFNAAFFAEDKIATGLMGLFVGRVLPAILNPSSTLIAGLFTGRDLIEAAKFSAIPWAGPLIAVPAQVRKDLNRPDLIMWNTTKRNFIANLSKINPAGGWGTQAEAELWKNLHDLAEDFNKFWGDEESKNLIALK